jgi:hypothetical protein
VEEVSYGQSRVCRLLGNPIAFTAVSLLAVSKDMTTGEIAKAIGRSIPRTSNILGVAGVAAFGLVADQLCSRRDEEEKKRDPSFAEGGERERNHTLDKDSRCL